MARTARQAAKSGVYQVMLRPVGGRTLFLTTADEARFLSVLAAERERDAVEFFAYCLLDKAVHFVCKEGLSPLTKSVMRIARTYANGYNAAHGRSGGLFYGRFQSLPLEAPDEILDATRFVHRLPLTVGLPLDCGRSSYRSYFYKKSELISTDAVLTLAGSTVDYRVYCDGEPTHRFLGK
jgi:hypothetical protein